MVYLVLFYVNVNVFENITNEINNDLECGLFSNSTQTTSLYIQQSCNDPNFGFGAALAATIMAVAAVKTSEIDFNNGLINTRKYPLISESTTAIMNGCVNHLGSFVDATSPSPRQTTTIEGNEFDNALIDRYSPPSGRLKKRIVFDYLAAITSATAPVTRTEIGFEYGCEYKIPIRSSCATNNNRIEKLCKTLSSGFDTAHMYANDIGIEFLGVIDTSHTVITGINENKIMFDVSNNEKKYNILKTENEIMLSENNDTLLNAMKVRLFRLQVYQLGILFISLILALITVLYLFSIINYNQFNLNLAVNQRVRQNHTNSNSYNTFSVLINCMLCHLFKVKLSGINIYESSVALPSCSEISLSLVLSS